MEIKEMLSFHIVLPLQRLVVIFGAAYRLRSVTFLAIHWIDLLDEAATRQKSLQASITSMN